MHKAVILTRILLLLAVSPAFAVASEGVSEINQTIVEHGLPPCDSTAGFPCVIDQPGSYRLTSNLVNSAGGPGYPDSIRIETDNVTLDLSGFAIIGPNDCSWNDTTSETTCTIEGATSGSGIVSTSRRVTVRNGTIRSSARNGIRLGPRSRARNLIISQAGGAGIFVDGGSLVHGCSAELTIASLISMMPGSIASDNTVRRGLGPLIFKGSVVARISISETSHLGLLLLGGTAVRQAHISSTVSDCIQHDSSDEDSVGSLTVDSILGACGGGGVHVLSTATSGLANTVITSTVGAIEGPVVELGTNLCNGSTSCP